MREQGPDSAWRRLLERWQVVGREWRRAAPSFLKHNPKVGCHKAKLERVTEPNTGRVLLRYWDCTLQVAKKSL